jgi:hypothetical protein
MPPYFDDKRIIQGDAKQLSKLFCAITTVPNELRASTAEKIFTRLFYKEPLDAAFTPLLAELKTYFIEQTNQDDSFYCNEKHPIRQVFQCFLTPAATWYARDSRPNQMFFDKITHLARLLLTINGTHGNSSKIVSLNAAIEDFYQWDEMEEKRASMLESRLCESELNTLKMLNAECQVLDLLNNTLAGRPIPINMQSTISTTLKTELQHCVFTAGIQSAFWKSWQRLLPLLGYVFNSNESQVDDQKLYRDIPAMLNELERSLQIGSSHPDSYRAFVEIVTQNLILAVQKQLPQCSLLKALAYPEGHSTINTRVTDTVLQQASIIHEGDWILFLSENDTTIRCKLALKNIDTDQLLFVDRYGRKVMIKSYKDFSLCFSAGIAKPLVPIDQDDVVARLIQALIELHDNNLPTPPTLPIEQAIPTSTSTANSQSESTTRGVSPRIEIPTLTKIAVFEEAPKAKDKDINEEEADLRRAAARKAMAEAHSLAEEKKQRAAEADLLKQKEQEKLAATQHAEIKQSEQLAQQQINLLNVGAWVEIQNATQQLQRCKLAVIIASAGKYIFVDNLGRKVAEYQRAQLVDAYINNQLTLINNGDKFEDQLVKVIRSLRKDIS